MQAQKPVDKLVKEKSELLSLIKHNDKILGRLEPFHPPDKAILKVVPSQEPTHHPSAQSAAERTPAAAHNRPKPPPACSCSSSYNCSAAAAEETAALRISAMP